MSLAVALLAGALFSGVLLPLLLRRLDLRRRDPAPVILAWILSALGVLLTASMGLALLLLPDHGLGNPAAAAVVDCWTTIQHGSIPRAEQWTTIAGAVAGVLITLRLVAVVGRPAETGICCASPGELTPTPAYSGLPMTARWHSASAVHPGSWC